MSENITAVLNIVANDQASNALKQVKDTTKKQKDEVERLIASTKRLVERQNKHKNVLEQLKLAHNNATDAQKAQLAMLHKQISANQKANGSLRMIRGGFGQMGHQVQDVAVQLQTGTDAMIVFGQQGSQIVSLFGPGGAMIGALLAVGAAIFSGVTMMSREAAKEVDDLVESIKNQRKELGLLTLAEKQQQQVFEQAKTAEFAEEAEKASTEVERLSRALKFQERLQQRINTSTEEALRVAQTYGVGLGDVESKIKQLNSRLIEARAAFDTVSIAADENTEAVIQGAIRDKQRRDTLDDLLMSLREEASALGLSERQLLERTLMLNKAEPLERKMILALFDKIDAHNKEAEATRKADAAARLKDKQDQARAAREEARLQNLLSGLQDFTDGREGVLARQYVTEFQMLQNATLKEIQSEENRNAMLLALRKKFAADIADLRGDGTKSGSSEEEALKKEGQRIIDSMRNFGKTEAQVLQDKANAKILILTQLAEQETSLEETVAQTIRSIRLQLAQDLDENSEIMHQKQMQRAQKELDKQFEIIGGYQTLETAASDALFSVFSHAQDADDALKGLAKTLVDEAIKGLIRMGMEQIKNALIADMIQKTAMTQAVATQTAAGAAIAAAMGPAALATSLATAGANATGATAGIAATTAALKASMLASFEGGGFTGRGARSGGVDGRGGFPAILHPNETVIDHDGGGMAPVVVNQTINVTTGVQQTVRAEIANLMPQISDAAKSAVAEGRMRGGAYGSAMGV